MIWRGTVLALGLAAVICCELRAGGGKDEPPRPPQVRPLPPIMRDLARAEPSAAELEVWAAAKASVILGRPLFRPDRQPAPALGTAAVGGPPPGEVLPRLAGIVVTASARRAIFADEDGKPVIASEGSRLGALQVVGISADRVTVAGPSGTFIIRPQGQAASSPAPEVVHRLGNTVSASGATFGAVPTDRLARLRDQVAASIQTLRAGP